MLITELKNKEAILSLVSGKAFIINCHGCKDMNIMDCMECRCCEYICSSKLPLVTMIKMGKNGVRGLK